MASIITHSVVALAAGKTLTSKQLGWRFWVLSLCCSWLPDTDAIGYWMGVPYADFWGHRGFSHSLLFAAIVSGIIVSCGIADPKWMISRWVLWCYFFLVTASHGLLDAITDGGLGVALLSPFDTNRYFFPWRPLEVSPIGIRAFFSEWGVRVLRSEIVWVWLPVLFTMVFVRRFRRQ